MEEKMTGNLDQIFENFLVGTTLKIDVNNGEARYEGPCVYAGNCGRGVKFILAEKEGNGIKYGPAFIIDSPEQISSMEKIPPLLEYFGLPIMGKRI